MSIWPIRVLRAFYSQATASYPRRIVSCLLLAWGLLDAVSTYRAWADLPRWAAVCGFFMSCFASLLFIGAVMMVWDWIASRRR